jgi:hypothetical protein
MPKRHRKWQNKPKTENWTKKKKNKKFTILIKIVGKKYLI